jgi:capsule polysaccharide export protein KpsE/RkpR
VEALHSRINADIGLLAKLRQDLVDAEADAAEYSQPGDRSDTEYFRHQLQAAQARAAELRKQTDRLAKAIDSENATLALRAARRDGVQSELKIAQAAFESAAAHLRDVRAAVGMRGERLRIVDPGIVPERPSSPNIPVNVIAALLAAAVASIVYLSLTFTWQRKTVGLAAVPPREKRA